MAAYKHRLVILLCFLVISPLSALAEQAHKARYESPFEGLFEGSKRALNALAKMHFVVKNDKAMNEHLNMIMKFVKTNPDKILAGAGLAASSWLLYQSILLANDVQGFFDDYVELKGQFDFYFRNKIVRLDDMFDRIKGLTGVSEETRREYYRQLYKELFSFYKDLDSILGKVDDILEDVSKAQFDARLSAALAGIAAIASGVVLATGAGPVVAPAVALSPAVWKSAMAGTAVISSAACALSLKNAADLSGAIVRLKNLKGDLKSVQNRAMSRVVEITELMV